MNTKKIPVLIMLLAGAVTCVVTFLNHYNLRDMLVALLIVLIIFLIVGLVIKFLFDKFEISTDDSVSDEGEVVEKQGDGEAVEEGEENSEINEENQTEVITDN